jgi:hypothetical protein
MTMRAGPDCICSDGWRCFPGRHGVEGCPCGCPLSTRPLDAHEWWGVVTFSDGQAAAVYFESHWLGGCSVYSADGQVEPQPSVEFHGECMSPTGYRSAMANIGEPREAGEAWEDYVREIALSVRRAHEGSRWKPVTACIEAVWRAQHTGRYVAWPERVQATGAGQQMAMPL